MIAFLGHYVGTIAGEWAARFGALLGLVSLFEFLRGKPLLPLITPRWKLGVAVALLVFAQASAYKNLYDRTAVNMPMIERLSEFIEEANKIKAGHRLKSSNAYDYTDPQRAVQWETAVCEYLTKTRDRSYCLRLKNRLLPLDNPEHQGRDWLDAAIDVRVERLELFQMELAKPPR